MKRLVLLISIPTNATLRKTRPLRGSASLAPPLGIFLLLVLLSCQSLPERDSRADWADVILYTTGVGPIREWSPQERILGIKQAKRDAARKLEEKILALRTDFGETLFEKAQKDNETKRKIIAYIRGAEVITVLNTAEGVQVYTRLVLGDHFKATLGLLPRKEIPSPQRQPEGSF